MTEKRIAFGPHRNLSRERILFLDYDGVLHPSEVYLTLKGIQLRAPGHTLFEGVPLLEKLLAEHLDLKIVLSTSWVKALSFHRARGYLSQELQERIIGATFHSGMLKDVDGGPVPPHMDWWAGSSRYQQILAFVMRHHIRSWIAIDDDVAQWAPLHLDNLIATKSALGLLGDPEAQARLRGLLMTTCR